MNHKAQSHLRLVHSTPVPTLKGTMIAPLFLQRVSGRGQANSAQMRELSDLVCTVSAELSQAAKRLNIVAGTLGSYVDLCNDSVMLHDDCQAAWDSGDIAAMEAMRDRLIAMRAVKAS